jgi:hypothetical protein
MIDDAVQLMELHFWEEEKAREMDRTLDETEK